MMNNETQIRYVKLAFLGRCAQAGLTPDEIGAKLRARLHEKRALLRGLSSLAATLMGLIKNTAIVGGAVGVGAGAVAGGLGEKIFGEDETDVEAARMREQIEQLQRSTIRMDALRASERAKRRQQKDEENGIEQASMRGQAARRPALQILSAR